METKKELKPKVTEIGFRRYMLVEVEIESCF